MPAVAVETRGDPASVGGADLSRCDVTGLINSASRCGVQRGIVGGLLVQFDGTMGEKPSPSVGPGLLIGSQNGTSRSPGGRRGMWDKPTPSWFRRPHQSDGWFQYTQSCISHSC